MNIVLGKVPEWLNFFVNLTSTTKRSFEHNIYLFQIYLSLTTFLALSANTTQLVKPSLKKNRITLSSSCA